MAGGALSMQVVGVAEAMRHLRGYDKRAYNTITKEMRHSATILTNAVGGDFPMKALTNWNGKPPAKRRSDKRPFPLYDAAAARGGVRPKVGIGKVVNNERSILRVQQMTAGGAVFDAAGSDTNNIFTRNLDIYAPTQGKSRLGISRSRVMYKAVDKRMNYVEAIVARCIDITDEAVQRAISAKGTF